MQNAKGKMPEEVFWVFSFCLCIQYFALFELRRGPFDCPQRHRLKWIVVILVLAQSAAARMVRRTSILFPGELP
jgi:hypothetical protein